MLVVIADTGPLWSFALVGRLDLLGERLSGRVEWTTAVEHEVVLNMPEVPQLADVLKQAWLPPPIDLASISLDLSLDAARIRSSLATSGDHSRKHLGEAESIAYAKTLMDVELLTEDQGAADRGRFEGLTVKRTTDVLAEMVAMDEATENDAYAIYTRLAGLGRLPGGITRGELFR